MSRSFCDETMKDNLGVPDAAWCQSAKTNDDGTYRAGMTGFSCTFSFNDESGETALVATEAPFGLKTVTEANCSRWAKKA